MTMMKGGSFRFRGKEASLLLIALVCATVLLWSWERTPSLSTLLPPPAVVSEPGFTSSKDVEAMVVATRIAVLPKEEIWPAAAETNLEDPPALVVGGNDNAESSNDLAEAEGNGGQGIGENELIERREAEGNGGQGIGENELIEEREAEGNGGQGIGESDLKEKREAEGNARQGVGENDLKEKEEAETKNRQGVGENYLKEKEQTLDLAPGVHSANANSSVIETDHKKSSSVLEESRVCEYSKGKWIVDDRRPLYSGFHCKQWLSQMWACRLTQRKDFAYERLRWEPKGCQMEDFEGSKFLKRMQDKTLAFVGDSLGRQQFQSLMCMITAGKAQTDVLDVGHKYGLIKPRGSARPSGWAYHFPSTNTTVLYYWSACLCDLEPINITNPATEYAMHLDRPPAFLRQYLHQIDVLVLNTGHHWNRGKLRANRWVMYVGGMPNTNKKLAMIGDAKNFTIHSIVSWVNAQLPKYPDLRAFYRSISPRHFVNGDWNTGGSCNNTTPLSIGKEVTQDESSDYSAGNAVRGTGVKLLDITALSQLRDEGHISRFSIAASAGVQDCLHWCLPGVPDTWNEILFAKINDDASLVQNEY